MKKWSNILVLWTTDNYTVNFDAIAGFHSRNQLPYFSIETKEKVPILLELNSLRITLGDKHGCRFFVYGHEHGRRDVTCKPNVVHFRKTQCRNQITGWFDFSMLCGLDEKNRPAAYRYFSTVPDKFSTTRD